MRTFIRFAGVALLVLVLVLSFAACGQQTTNVTQPDDTTKEVVVETAPPSPTPTPTPTPSVPPVAVTTVPMPMPSVTPTVSVTAPDATDASSATATATPTASPSPSPAAAAGTNNNYSPDAAFASTIKPDGVNKPSNTVSGYIIGNDVNFRAGPSASARLLGTFDSGTRVEILGTEYGWTEVVINGVAGYVKSEYVSAGSYGSGNSVIVGGNGSTMVIVPDGPAGSVVNTGDGDNFLGILPD